MDPRFELFYRVLGVITPDIINKLTTISMGEHRSSLTNLILDEEGFSLKGEMGKVIKIEEGILKKENEKVEAEKEPSSDDVEGATLTILEVKKKLKKSQKKLKTSEVFGMYKSNALVDINQERKNKTDMNKSSNLGILINKKQA